MVADDVEASSDTPAVVVDSAGAGTAAGTAVAEAVDIVAAEAVGTAVAVGVADMVPAELGPAAPAAPLDPYDVHAHSTHHPGHVAAQIDPSTIFDAPWARSLGPLARELHESQRQLQPHAAHSGE